MQSKTVKNDMVLFPIPKDLLDEIGLDSMDVIQMSVANGKLIIEKPDTDDFVCDGDCDNCPFGDTDCDEDCENCPCYEECEEDEDDEDDEFICPIRDSCDKCQYLCPTCGQCWYEFDEEDFEDE